MARPEVGEVAEELYERLAVSGLTAGDEDRGSGWELLKFCDAICTPLLERVHTYAADRDDQEGWVAVFDPENAPAEALSYLSQFVGVELEPSLTEAEQREKIALPEGFRRGSRDALRAAVKRTLTGSKSVFINNRLGGSAYALEVNTLASETPDPDATLAAILSQKPVGIVLTFNGSTTSATYAEVAAEYTDYADLEASNDSYADVLILPD